MMNYSLRESIIHRGGGLKCQINLVFLSFFHSSLGVELMDAVRCALKWRTVIETSGIAAGAF